MASKRHKLEAIPQPRKLENRNRAKENERKTSEKTERIVERADGGLVMVDLGRGEPTIRELNQVDWNSEPKQLVLAARRKAAGCDCRK